MENRLAIYSMLVFFTSLFLISIVFAASWSGQDYDSKYPPPEEIIDSVKELIIAKGISESYFNEHFSLISANVDSSLAGNVWEQVSIVWNFEIDDDYAVPYEVHAYRIDESFIETEDYTIEDGVAYLFQTKYLHEFGSLMPLAQAQEELAKCLGYKPDVEVPDIRSSGDLYISAAKPLDNSSLQSSVNLETGEMACYERPFVDLNQSIAPENDDILPISLKLVLCIAGVILAIVLVTVIFMKSRGK